MAEILLIEPNPILAKLYSQSLTQAGHSLRISADAQQSINLIDQLRPDLIILELQLVDHNGIEFLYELRSYPDWQTIPVILHTMVPSNALRLDVATLERLGVVGTLYKSTTSLKQLRETIDNLLILSI